METITTPEEKISHIKEYVNIRLRILKLQAAEKTGEMTSAFISGIVTGVIFFLAVIFLSIAAGFYFSALFESQVKGFLLVGLAYSVVLILLVIFRKPLLSNQIRDKVINALLN